MGFDFDTEIILQLLEARKSIVEVPIPTLLRQRDLPRERHGLREGCRARRPSVTEFTRWASDRGRWRSPSKATKLKMSDHLVTPEAA